MDTTLSDPMVDRLLDGRYAVESRLARGGMASVYLATDTALLGSPAYLAPEQVRDGTADARTDVYAAGIMLFELLTGRPPYAGEHALAVANQRLSEDVPAPSSFASGVPAEVDALVLAATAREPDERPADAGALHRSLVAVRNRLGLHAAVPTLPTAATTVLSAPRQDTLVVGLSTEGAAAVPAAPSKKRR